MSVIIKGMKMPKSCDSCDLIQFDDEELEAHCPLSPYYRWCGTPPDYRPEGCLLVEIPTPHGDLVDRDDLTDEINRVTFAERYDYNVAYNIVTDAETIIEAEHKSEAQKWARVGRDISKGLQEGIEAINSEVIE